MSPDVYISLMILALMFQSMFTGAVGLLLYFVKRMLGADGWDKSNMTNALRLIAHLIMHPEDFAHMYYTVPSAGAGGRIVSRKCFPYVNKDELSEVVKTRPTLEEKLP